MLVEAVHSVVDIAVDRGYVTNAVCLFPSGSLGIRPGRRWKEITFGNHGDA